MSKTPKCPQCKKPGKPTTEGMYQCPKCDGFFDSDPNEGGDYSDRRADERLLREETRSKGRRRS